MSVNVLQVPQHVSIACRPCSSSLKHLPCLLFTAMHGRHQRQTSLHLQGGTVHIRSILCLPGCTFGTDVDTIAQTV